MKNLKSLLIDKAIILINDTMSGQISSVLPEMKALKAPPLKHGIKTPIKKKSKKEPKPSSELVAYAIIYNKTAPKQNVVIDPATIDSKLFSPLELIKQISNFIYLVDR